VTLCSVTVGYQCFGAPFYFHLQGEATTWCYKPGVLNSNLHCHENLKSHTKNRCPFYANTEISGSELFLYHTYSPSSCWSDTWETKTYHWNTR